MGRTAAFDRDTVITNARNLFWTRGYEATAVPDLEKATGLKRSSLYNTFGSKKGLFDAVTENYLNTAVRPLLARITADDAPSDALLTYFATIAGSIKSAEKHPGCLLVAAANSPIGQDAAVRTTITGYYEDLVAAFTVGVQKLHPELSREEAEHKTRPLVALMVSAMALARTNKDLALANLDAAQELAQAA